MHKEFFEMFKKTSHCLNQLAKQRQLSNRQYFATVPRERISLWGDSSFPFGTAKPILMRVVCPGSLNSSGCEMTLIIGFVLDLWHQCVAMATKLSHCNSSKQGLERLERVGHAGRRPWYPWWFSNRSKYPSSVLNLFLRSLASSFLGKFGRSH